MDFYCKDLQLAIEVDGSIHFEEGWQAKDRFSDLDVKNNLDWVLEEIRTAIEDLEPTPNPSKEGKSH